MDLEKIKMQILKIHEAIMLLNEQYRLEAIDYLDECCNALRLKSLTYGADSNTADHVLNLTKSHKEFPFRPDDNFDDIHIPSFCYPPPIKFDNPVEEQCCNYTVDDYSMEAKDVKLRSLDTQFIPTEIADNGHIIDAAVNLVMTDKNDLHPNIKSSRRKQMSTRKNVRQKDFALNTENSSPSTTNTTVGMIEIQTRTIEEIQSENKTGHNCVCTACHKKFTTTSELKSHASSCQNVDTYYCIHCNKKFMHKRHYLQHLAGHKQNDCKFCTKKFSSKENYRNHLKRAHPEVKDENNLIPCKFCPMIFSRLQRLYNHYQLNHSKGKFVCVLCGLFLATKDKYKEHMLVHDNDMKWICHICSKKFFSKSILETHLKRHSISNYRCLTCKITVASKEELLTHKRKAHEVLGLEASLECDTCHKMFRKKYDLKRHISTHSQEKPFSCLDCKKHFVTMNALAKHKARKIHANMGQHDPPESKFEKIYQDKLVCEDCGKQYRTINQLNNHRRCHITSFCCDLCGLVFSLKSNLRRHVKAHMGKTQAVCELCGDSFARIGGLREHTLLKHSDSRYTRAFQCQSCPKAFKRFSELKRHTNIHTMTRPHVCFCGRNYKQIAHLRSHQKSVHSRPTPSTAYLQSNTPLLTIGHFDGSDYDLQQDIANYGPEIEYPDVAADVTFSEHNSVSPAVDLTMVPDNKPEATMPLVNLSESIVQEYLLTLP